MSDLPVSPEIERAVEKATTALGGNRRLALAALAAAYPHVEAHLRRQIAVEIEAMPNIFTRDAAEMAMRYTVRKAARIARGVPSTEPETQQ